MACPDGQYFCNDKQKCMPIPKGHKVRKDGELVKEGKRKVAYESTTLPRKNGRTMYVTFTWRGKYMNLQMFLPSLNKPSKAEIQSELVKVYPGAQCKYYYTTDRDPTEPLLQVGEAVDALDRRAQMIARRQYILDRQKMVLRRKELNQNRQGDQEVANDKKKDLTKKLMDRSKEKEGQVTRAESLIRHMRQ